MTTEHDYVEERLSPYLDGELSAQELSTVEHHLSSCQECQWSLETLKQTVQWTMELPSVPVPRMFTIPVPAQPERSPRWRWSLPLLQGATALVAVLLFFVAAGDMFMTGLGRTTEAPAAVMLGETADIQITFEAEAEQVLEAPVEKAAPPQPVPETVDLETLPADEVEADSVEPSVADSDEPAAPAESWASEASPTPGVAATPMPESAASPVPENGSMGAGFGTPSEEAKEAEVEAEGEAKAVEEARVMAPQAASTEPIAATSAVEPSPAPLPTIAPTQTLLPAPTPIPPTIVALVPEPAPSTNEEQAITGAAPDPWVRWVGVAEIILAVAFVLLAATTVLMMIQRRRTG